MIDVSTIGVYTASAGSYPRIGSPAGQVLRKTWNLYAQRRASLEEVRIAENNVAKEVIEEEIQAGIDIVTDGLVRWQCPLSHIAGRMEGVSVGALHHFLDTNFHVRKAVVEAFPKWKTPLVADEIRFASTITSGPLKAVLTGPATFLRYTENKTSHEKVILGRAYVYALCQEIELLSALQGVAMIQIDDPCILDWEYERREYVGWYSDLYRALEDREDRVLLEIKTYGKECAEMISQLLMLPCNYLGIDCVIDKKAIGGLLKNAELLEKTGRGLALGIVNARSSIMEDPYMLECIVEPLFFYTERPLILEASSGLEFVPRRFAKEKYRILAETKQLLLESSLYRDTVKMLARRNHE